MHAVMCERSFEKSKVLNDFINDICKSKRSSVSGSVENWGDL